MNCAVHSDLTAQGFCRNCGKAMCDTCKRDVRGILYCEDCLAATVAAPTPVAGGGPSPGLATFLGFIPGLGAVYNGEYMKALIHFMIFAGLATLTSHEILLPFSGLAIAALFIYMPIEARHTAKARLLGQKSTMPFSDLGRTDQPIGAWILIGMGILILLGRLDFIPWEKIMDYAIPLGLIAAGVMIIRKRLGAAAPPQEKQP